MHNFFELPLKVVFIVGSCRSGKTSIGRLISTSKNAEFIDEPPLLVSLPILSKIGRIAKKEAISMFQSYLRELVFDVVLMRRINFRPYDDSSIWKTTSVDEILMRISLKRKKDAYSYISDYGFTVVISLPNNIGNIDFISEAHPGSKIIKVVRNGANVADLTREKSWFSDLNLISGFEELVISKFMDSNDNAWNLPWWVDDSDRGVFLGFSEYERGLYYWCQTNKFTKSSSKLPNVFSVSFENFINEILITKHDIFNFLEIKGSSMTNVVELELSKYKNISDVDDSSYNIENLLKIKYKEIVKENYG
jgi:hypothetical protein